MSIFQAWLSEKSSEIFLDPNEYANFRESLQENGIWIGKPGLYKFDYNFMGQVSMQGIHKLAYFLSSFVYFSFLIYFRLSCL